MIRILCCIIIAQYLLMACSTAYKPSVDKVEADTQTKINIYPLADVSDTIRILFLENTIANSLIKASPFQNVKALYSQNNFSPLWRNDSLIQQGIQLINNSKYHGLNPTQYNKLVIDSLNNIQKSDTLNRIRILSLLDIAITDGILLFSKHLLIGKLTPTKYHPTWNYSQRNNNKADSLILSLVKQKDITKIEKLFQPKTKAYSALQHELIKFEQLSSDENIYGAIEYPGFVLRKGDSNKYVLPLKQELKIRGYLEDDSISINFDLKLENAVKAFQIKHGLTADGIPGKKTYEFLSWSLEKYINTICVNMERMRWMSDSMPDEYIKVNIPAYQLKLYTNKQLLFNSKIIVGKYKNQTPVFESDIDYLVFNPCWTIPNSIASKKILPRLKTDSTYLDKRKMFISVNGVKQDHANIDFTQFNETNFPYKIFQRTGPGNALGKVKFMFQNGYSIYLHDTPGKSLFSKDHRAFSHGCVRVQNAVSLSEIILYKLDENTRLISYYFDKGYPEKVYLKTPIPLYLQYFTCDYNVESNQVQFFKDVYAIDYKILNDLKANHK